VLLEMLRARYYLKSLTIAHQARAALFHELSGELARGGTDQQKPNHPFPVLLWDCER
jgi:hypothetical protein